MALTLYFSTVSLQKVNGRKWENVSGLVHPQVNLLQLSCLNINITHVGLKNG